MMSLRVHATLAAVCIAVCSGCTAADNVEPSGATTASTSESIPAPNVSVGDRSSALEYDRPPPPVTLPDLTQLSESLQNQIRAQYAVVLQKAEDARTPPLELDSAYGELALILREGLAEAPDDAGLHNWLGSALMMTGDTRGAGEEFSEALRLDPELELAHLGLGVLLSASGRHSEAVDRFRRAVELQPNYIQGRLGLADALRAMGQLEESLVQLERVVQLNPSLVDVWMARAMTLIQLGRFRETRDVLTQATVIHANDLGLTDLLVRVLAAAPDDTVRDGALALALMQERINGPLSLEMYETMAMALAEVGQFDEAATWQRQAMSVAEQNGLGDVARTMSNALALYEQGRPVRGLFGVADP